MSQYISTITLLVDDYDEALNYYKNVLLFDVIEDIPLNVIKRRIIVRPKNSNNNIGIVLAKATNDEQKMRVGNQVGGRVMLILNTDNFDEDYKLYKRNGVEFMEEPRNEKYGKVVVFKDLYGNMYDLIENKN
jgi:lactoylglutathione lyase